MISLRRLANPRFAGDDDVRWGQIAQHLGVRVHRV